MLTFQAALKHANQICGANKSKILLLGNGFSRACAIANAGMGNDDFNYTNLLNVIQRSLPNGRSVQEFFDLMNTTNFENLLHNLLMVNEVMQFIRGANDESIVAEINQYYQEIQDHLAESISRVHPSHQGISLLITQLHFFLSLS